VKLSYLDSFWKKYSWWN